MGNRHTPGTSAQKDQRVFLYDTLVWDRGHHQTFIGLDVGNDGNLCLHRAGGVREEIIYITEPLGNTLHIGVYLPLVNRYTRHTVFLLPTSRELVWEYPYINATSSLPERDIPVFHDARVFKVEEYEVHRPRFIHPLVDRLSCFLHFETRSEVQGELNEFRR